MKKFFSSKEAAKLSELSIYMLDYLVRQKIVMPNLPKSTGRGKQRQFRFGEIVLLKAVKKMLDNGISVSRLKKAIKTKNRIFREMAPTEKPSRFFVTDGKSIYFKDETTAGHFSFVDLSSDGQLAFNFVIDLHDLHASLSADVRKLAA